MPYAGHLPEPPPAVSGTAERRSWFSQANAARVLDWLDATNINLLGIDAARKLPDGNWMLLVDLMLASSDATPITIADGRRFLDENNAPDMMFEPVW